MAAKGKLKTKPQEPEELTPEQVEELKETLLSIRNNLNSKAQERKKDGLYEISRDDLADESDLASVETDQEVGLKLAEQEMHKLTLVERALSKIKSNTYGFCEGTGEPIGYKRLKVQPWVLYSLKHQEDLERGRKAD